MLEDSTDELLKWRWADRDLTIGLTRIGSGPRLLLFPALSSVSSRTEMSGLQARLAASFETMAIDLPGFGALPKPKVAWSPEAYRAFFRWAVERLRPAACIGAGHSAAYLLQLAAETGGLTGPLALIAPTWRGPLPTMLGRRPSFLDKLAKAADFPVLGSLLYRLNVNGPVIGMMTRGHVYADGTKMLAAHLPGMLAVTRAKGARHASVRFVCGALDAVQSREAFLNVAKAANVPMLAIYGSATPRRSLAEMKALSEIPGVETVIIPAAKLAVHEEYPDATARAVSAFLGQRSPLKPRRV